MIVGGHDNALLSNTNKRAVGPYPTVVNDVQIIQAYAYGKYLGELNLVFDDAGNVISAEGEPILIDSSVEEDPQIVTRLDILEKPINKLKETQVGNVSASLNGDRAVCRVQECDMGNMIADAHCGPTLHQPKEIEQQILNIAGVVQVGLFNDMCDVVVLAGSNGVETFVNPNGRIP